MGCNILDRWECRRCRVVVAGNENPDAAVMKKPRNATIEDRRLMIIRCFCFTILGARTRRPINKKCEEKLGVAFCRMQKGS